MRVEGPWIETWSGLRFDLLDPKPEQIILSDIAHALGSICRFTGHCHRYYSVAQHCMLVAKHVEHEHKTWALLHDAAEAYLGDVSRPLKFALGNEYRIMETMTEAAIMQRFEITVSAESLREVKKADLRMLATEKRDLLPGMPIEEWALSEMFPPYPGSIGETWGPEEATQKYLSAVTGQLMITRLEKDATAS